MRYACVFVNAGQKKWEADLEHKKTEGRELAIFPHHATGTTERSKQT